MVVATVVMVVVKVVVCSVLVLGFGGFCEMRMNE